jgi:ankyrin repeat protein
MSIKNTTHRLAGIFALSLLLVAATAPAESPVADAAQDRDVAQVRMLLQQGADVNAAQSDGLTALHWAALNDDAEIVGLLLYAGATVRPLTRVGAYTPLHLASRAGHDAVARALLDGGADANQWTSTGVTALHFAAQANSSATIRALAEHGADLNAPDGFQSRTPLVFASSRNAIDAVTALLELGADPSLATDLKDYTSMSALDGDDRAHRSRLRAAEAGNDPVMNDNQDRFQAAQAAAPDSAAAEEDEDEEHADDEDDEEHVDDDDDLLIEKDALEGLKAPLDALKAPEEHADEEETEDEKPAVPAIRALSSAEQIGVQGGMTALHYAAREGHIETAKLLITGGADIDQPSNGDLTTPLLASVINGNYDLAMVLLELGADPNALSDDAAGPLFATLNIEWSLRTWYPQPQMFRTQEASYLDLMEALLEAGADPNQQVSTHIWYAAYNAGRMGVDFTGATPFWRAAYATDVTAMRLLESYGADTNMWTTKLPARRRNFDPGNPTSGDDEEDELDPSGLPEVPVGGPAVHPMHAASGVGFGTSRVAQQHRSVPDGWLPSMKYFIEELGMDPNVRDMDGFSPLHMAAARGDNETILYLVEQGADVTLVSRRGQTTADMANSPEQRAQPHPATIALLEKLGSENNHNCQSCGTGGN